MSQPQKKRKWKTYEKKNRKEAAANAVVLQNKLKNLNQIFADSSGDEDDSTNHDYESFQRSANEEEAMARSESVRSVNVSTSNHLAIKDHSDEQSYSGSSSSIPLPKQSNNQGKGKSLGEEDKEEQEYITSEDEDSSQTAEEEDDEDSGTEQRNSADEEDLLIPTTETTKAQNMARAIARILGESTFGNHGQPNKAVILSKTRTKIQKMQSEAREEKKTLILKRSERKQINLSSMYIPPPIHSNSNGNKGYSSAASSPKKAIVAQELQNDRTYRRIATRGVVALFNAIAQHQREQKQEATAEETSDKKNNSTATSQREFIQKIKESAVTKQQPTQLAKINNMQERKSSSTNSTNKKSTGWSALKDDYMMSSNNLKVSLSSFYL
jgi:hypothetical protein